MIICPPELRYAMLELGKELKDNRLDVALSPAPDGTDRMVRVVQGENPEWYRRLCRQYPSAARRAHSKREFDTRVRRYDVATTIRVLATRGRSASQFAKFLVDEARNYVALELADAENSG